MYIKYSMYLYITSFSDSTIMAIVVNTRILLPTDEKQGTVTQSLDMAILAALELMTSGVQQHMSWKNAF